MANARKRREVNKLLRDMGVAEELVGVTREGAKTAHLKEQEKKRKHKELRRVARKRRRTRETEALQAKVSRMEKEAAARGAPAAKAPVSDLERHARRTETETRKATVKSVREGVREKARSDSQERTAAKAQARAKRKAQERQAVEDKKDRVAMMEQRRRKIAAKNREATEADRSTGRGAVKRSERLTAEEKERLKPSPKGREWLEKMEKGGLVKRGKRPAPERAFDLDKWLASQPSWKEPKARKKAPVPVTPEDPRSRARKRTQMAAGQHPDLKPSERTPTEPRGPGKPEDPRSRARKRTQMAAGQHPDMKPSERTPTEPRGPGKSGATREQFLAKTKAEQQGTREKSAKEEDTENLKETLKATGIEVFRTFVPQTPNELILFIATGALVGIAVKSGVRAYRALRAAGATKAEATQAAKKAAQEAAEEAAKRSAKNARRRAARAERKKKTAAEQARRDAQNQRRRERRQAKGEREYERDQRRRAARGTGGRRQAAADAADAADEAAAAQQARRDQRNARAREARQRKRDEKKSAQEKREARNARARERRQKQADEQRRETEAGPKDPDAKYKAYQQRKSETGEYRKGADAGGEHEYWDPHQKQWYDKHQGNWQKRNPSGEESSARGASNARARERREHQADERARDRAKANRKAADDLHNTDPEFGNQYHDPYDQRWYDRDPSTGKWRQGEWDPKGARKRWTDPSARDKAKANRKEAEDRNHDSYYDPHEEKWYERGPSGRRHDWKQSKDQRGAKGTKEGREAGESWAKSAHRQTAANKEGAEAAGDNKYWNAYEEKWYDKSPDGKWRQDARSGEGAAGDGAKWRAEQKRRSKSGEYRREAEADDKRWYNDYHENDTYFKNSETGRWESGKQRKKYRDEDERRKKGGGYREERQRSYDKSQKGEYQREADAAGKDKYYDHYEQEWYHKEKKSSQWESTTARDSRRYDEAAAKARKRAERDQKKSERAHRKEEAAKARAERDRSRRESARHRREAEEAGYGFYYNPENGRYYNRRRNKKTNEWGNWRAEPKKKQTRNKERRQEAEEGGYEDWTKEQAYRQAAQAKNHNTYTDGTNWYGRDSQGNWRQYKEAPPGGKARAERGEWSYHRDRAKEKAGSQSSRQKGQAWQEARDKRRGWGQWSTRQQAAANKRATQWMKKAMKMEEAELRTIYDTFNIQQSRGPSAKHGLDTLRQYIAEAIREGAPVPL